MTRFDKGKVTWNFKNESKRIILLVTNASLFRQWEGLWERLQTHFPPAKKTEARTPHQRGG